MDRELFNESAIGNTFERRKTKNKIDHDDDYDGIEEVDVEYNLLKNMLDSQAFQMNMPVDAMSQILSNFNTQLSRQPPMRKSS
jgi:hypothetical protein